MKRMLLMGLLSMFGLGSTDSATADEQPRSFFTLSATDIQGQTHSLSEYEGKVVLVVNVASRCGFTKQYAGLQALFDRYKDRGLVILGFPSNDFMGQEPGTDSEIKTFCSTTYGVNFPLFTKGAVTGDGKQPVFKYLTEETSKPMRGGVLWNFEKFLISRKGQLVARYRSATAPESESIVKAIEEQLAQ